MLPRSFSLLAQSVDTYIFAKHKSSENIKRFICQMSFKIFRTPPIKRSTWIHLCGGNIKISLIISVWELIVLLTLTFWFQINSIKYHLSNYYQIVAYGCWECYHYKWHKIKMQRIMTNCCGCAIYTVSPIQK